MLACDFCTPCPWTWIEFFFRSIRLSTQGVVAASLPGRACLQSLVVLSDKHAVLEVLVVARVSYHRLVFCGAGVCARQPKRVYAVPIDPAPQDELPAFCLTTKYADSKSCWWAHMEKSARFWRPNHRPHEHTPRTMPEAKPSRYPGKNGGRSDASWQKLQLTFFTAATPKQIASLYNTAAIHRWCACFLHTITNMFPLVLGHSSLSGRQQSGCVAISS